MQDRVVPLEGVLNFRDYGGYRGHDGATVRRGLLYRSAHFAEASEADARRLDALKVQLVVDLRRPEERQASPNRWPGDPAITAVNDDGPKELPPHVAVLMQTDLTSAATDTFMRDSYRTYPFESRYVALYRALFRGLLDLEGPVVLHCAAGKDRTGVGCALVLSALGVHWDEIVADYELTNVVVDLSGRLLGILARMEERLGRTLDPEAVRPMLGVHADYLRSAFAAITAEGSVFDYLDATLGVSAADVARLREKLLA